MNTPRILAVGTATPTCVTQEESLALAGYQGGRSRQIFLNSDIDYRCFYLEGKFRGQETSDEMNGRYLRGAMNTGCRAIRACLESAQMDERQIDLIAVCTSTGYVCPDLGSRLIGHMGFRADVQRASIIGLGCAGAMPALQRTCDFVRSHPGLTALMLAVEICSACYYKDDTLETVVANAICSDGAAAFLLSDTSNSFSLYPMIIDFESFVDSDHIDMVGFTHTQGKLRVVLATAVRHLAAPMIERALLVILRRHGLSLSDIRFWVAHPGGRKVIDNVQRHFGLSDDQVKFSRIVLRNYGNMSSPTVMFVLDEVLRSGEPESGDWGLMIALGPGMAAEVALLRW
jgi:predicted naringenin-chalcone synthase